MKISKIEQHLKKLVTIKLFDNEVLTGILHKTGAEYLKNTPELYLKKNYYFIAYNCYGNSSSLGITYLFRASHVKKLKLME